MAGSNAKQRGHPGVSFIWESDPLKLFDTYNP